MVFDVHNAMCVILQVAWFVNQWAFQMCKNNFTTMAACSYNCIHVKHIAILIAINDNLMSWYLMVYHQTKHTHAIFWILLSAQFHCYGCVLWSIQYLAWFYAYVLESKVQQLMSAMNATITHVITNKCMDTCMQQIRIRWMRNRIYCNCLGQLMQFLRCKHEPMLINCVAC